MEAHLRLLDLLPEVVAGLYNETIGNAGLGKNAANVK